MRCASSLSRQERELIQRRGTSNAEAYDLYLRGQAHLRDGTDTEMNPAIEFFREAIRRDERFAQAHAGIAHAQSLKGLWRVGMTQADFDEAFAASRRALELEPRMPEAYIARAMLLSLQGRDGRGAPGLRGGDPSQPGVVRRALPVRQALLPGR